ncbi:MAG: YgjV family protein [Methanobrevibacter sp.]|jgi:hypothetical protein|nr:YgjV family protein [Candidatus Methanovirga meridionalis]
MSGIDIFTLITITGIIAILFNITSVLINRKILIIFTGISNIFFTIHFLLLNDHVSAFSCIVISILALITYIYYSKDSETPELIIISFIFIFLSIGHFDKNVDLDGIGILPVLASVFILFGLQNKNIIISRLYFFTCALLWIIYDLNFQKEAINMLPSGGIQLIFNINIPFLLSESNIINQVLLIIVIFGSFLIHDVLNKKTEEIDDY